ADAKEAGAERNAGLALEARRIGAEEREAARHRPLARLGRVREHEGVGRIEPDGAQQLHPRGPAVAGSSQVGAASAGSKRCFLTVSLPICRTSKSPTPSIVRSVPASAGSRDK